MHKQFDVLSMSLPENASRRGPISNLRTGMTGLLLALFGATFALPAGAEDLYVSASAISNGNGTAGSPYLRITDAVARARQDRQTTVLPLSETITIHVGPGTYTGSFSNSGAQLEAFPIVLNVPNLTLQGSTALTLDTDGLPTGVSKKAPQSVLVSKGNPNDLATAFLILTTTTDGSAGNVVTVTGLTINGGSGFMGIIVDHVSAFALQGNDISGSYSNLYTRAASGTISANLLNNSNTLGVLSEGGTGLFPANVSVNANRIDSNGEVGVVGVAYPSDLTLDLGQSGLTAMPYQFGLDLPDGLSLSLTGNDISANTGVGVRLFVSPFAPNAAEILGAGSPLLSAALTGNTINNNQRYGLVVDGGDAPLGFSPFSGSVLVSLASNSLTGNGIQPGLFTFYNFFDTIQGTHKDGHLQQAVCQIFDTDGELSGFDYDNPVLDPATGTPLNGGLFVNGSPNVLGLKLSFKP